MELKKPVRKYGRNKRLREHLRYYLHWTALWPASFVLGMTVVAGGGIACVFAIVLIGSLFAIPWYGTSAVAVSAICLCVAAISGTLCWLSNRLLHEGEWLIPKPPVENPILPARDLLVRASSPSSETQKQELLRAAQQQSQETPVEELLRVVE